MKLGFITKEDPFDKTTYSGTHFSMLSALQDSFDEVIPLGPFDHSYKWVAKAKGKMLHYLTGKTHKFQYDSGLAKRMSALLDKNIQAVQPDVLLGSLVTPECAFLETNIPLFLTTDATAPLLRDVYRSHTNLTRYSIQNSEFLEAKAYQKAKKLLLPLQWLADSAVGDYQVPASKIEVIPYGPNFSSTLAAREMEGIINNRVEADVLRLLFVGVRWEEKGGPLALEIFRRLKKKEVNIELHIAGCEPPLEHEQGLYVHGFLRKTNDKEVTRLIDLFRRASFFILPTQAECVGMSFLEANAFALPSIGTMVGGVPEAVFDQENGMIITDDSTIDDITNWVVSSFEDKARYASLSRKAYALYSEKLNWTHWSHSVRKIMNDGTT